MANNTYTLSDLTKAVVHVLGGQPDSNLSTTQIVNGALNNLANHAPWTWRQKALSVPSVANQSYINLPTDFQEFLTVKRAGDTTCGMVESVTIDRIIEARQSGATTLAAGGAGLFYCLNFTPQTSVTAEPTPIVELYPTPTSLINPFLVGVYLRQIPKLSGSTDLPDIPSTFHELLLWWCRAYAVAYETGQFGADAQMVSNLLAECERLDGRSQGHVGRMRGGLATSILGPSLAAQTGLITVGN